MAENGSIIEVQVDEAMQRAIELKLKNLKNKAPKALKNALNATAREAKKDLAAKAQQQYTIKSTKFKKQIKQKNATNTKPEALLKISGELNQLESFQTRKNTKKLAAKAHGLVKKPLKEIISTKGEEGGGKAFMTTFQNGHKAIAQRDGKAKLPLHGFYGPSNPEMIGNDKVYGKIKPDIQKMLLKQINTQIKKMLEAKT